jgi:hypothetical protein
MKRRKSPQGKCPQAARQDRRQTHCAFLEIVFMETLVPKISAALWERTGCRNFVSLEKQSPADRAAPNNLAHRLELPRLSPPTISASQEKPRLVLTPEVITLLRPSGEAPISLISRSFPKLAQRFGNAPAAETLFLSKAIVGKPDGSAKSGPWRESPRLRPPTISASRKNPASSHSRGVTLFQRAGEPSDSLITRSFPKLAQRFGNAPAAETLFLSGRNRPRTGRLRKICPSSSNYHVSAHLPSLHLRKNPASSHSRGDHVTPTVRRSANPADHPQKCAFPLLALLTNSLLTLRPPRSHFLSSTRSMRV